jgi:hypothetical protein
MARITDPSTPEELLWREAVELVAELTGSPDSAEALLVAYLPENIGLRYVLEEGYSSPGFPVKSAPDKQGNEPPDDKKWVWVNRDPTPHNQKLWHPDSAAGERLIINREDSSARWTGPPKYLPLKHFKPPPTDFTVRLIFLRRDDIIKVLRFARLLPSAAATSAPPEPPELPRGATERWVFEAMRDNPPRKDDRAYAKNLHKRCPFSTTLKTVQNYVGKYRARFERPE